ncbi:flagellar hook-length control protein FliK [Sphingosinicella sp. LHD-64]|uniref:flagellar hook-length control protein FliK n=1 Tax=Sphingosinicella sp. LHD-64 TaxID=3072139 RepID=UPI0028107D7C|nr:flagellar hook-length control protein FliK [Sphingosinicella sp. LHD-64]MDQ8757163.1 flagellar hook-length control protein FliK [Sphingosinicella sp. LHD-64]
MATAPNMNVAPMVPQVGLPPSVEGEGGDLFASLLPIVTGTAAPKTAAPDATARPVTTGGAGPGVPQPGIVEAPALAIDLHAAAPKTEGDGRETGEAAAADDAAPSPEADLLPLLQAQSMFPVTVVTAPVPARATAPASEGSEAAPPSPASQPIATTVPQPPVTLAATPLPLPAALSMPAADAMVAGDPAVTVAVREAVRTLSAKGQTESGDPPASAKTGEVAKGEGEGAASPASAKTGEVAKGDMVQPVRLPAGVGVPAPAVPSATAGSDPVTDRSGSAEKPVAPVAAPAQAPTVQAPIGGTVTPVVVMSDPAAALQTVPAGTAASQPAPAAADAAIARELDLAHDSEWLDRLARDIARTGANDGPMRFKLNPATLGHLQVELTQGDLGTSVRLTVETEAARSILADAQPRLMAEARAQGVRIGESHIDLAGQGHQAASGDPRRHQDDARQTVLIRTARGSAGEADETAAPARGHADRYA